MMEASTARKLTHVPERVRRTARRKRDEVFSVEFNYKGKDYKLTVKSDYPAGPECMGCDYDVFQGRKHLYTLNHCKNEDDILCWEIKKKPAEGHDPEFARQIGLAIAAYYGD